MIIIRSIFLNYLQRWDLKCKRQNILGSNNFIDSGYFLRLLRNPSKNEKSLILLYQTYVFKMAGLVGFEPTHDRFRVCCLTA